MQSWNIREEWATDMEQLKSTVPILIIDGNEIDNVQYTKLLGVTISSDLTWTKHVEYIVAKAGKRV